METEGGMKMSRLLTLVAVLCVLCSGAWAQFTPTPVIEVTGTSPARVAVEVRIGYSECDFANPNDKKTNFTVYCYNPYGGSQTPYKIDPAVFGSMPVIDYPVNSFVYDGPTAGYIYWAVGPATATSRPWLYLYILVNADYAHAITRYITL